MRIKWKRGVDPLVVVVVVLRTPVLKGTSDIHVLSDIYVQIANTGTAALCESQVGSTFLYQM